MLSISFASFLVGYVVCNSAFSGIAAVPSVLLVRYLHSFGLFVIENKQLDSCDVMLSLLAMYWYVRFCAQVYLSL